MRDTKDMALQSGFMGKDDSCGMYAQSEFDGEICLEEYAIGEKIRRFEALVRADERAALTKLLDGIDKTQIESDEGWWETSTGAEFGSSVLKIIRARGETK